AEMPGLYSGEDFDLAGFAVGAMERGSGLPRDVSEGDVVLGLASNGIHSNGYSLVRRIIESEGLAWDAPFDGVTLGEAVLRPTRLYVAAARSALDAGGVHALAHITGGGLTENLPRALPEGLGVKVDLDQWALPKLFGWLSKSGGVSQAEMLKTFNCGIGLAVIVEDARLGELSTVLAKAGEQVIELGRVVSGEGVHYSGSLL
ncbi:MAG: AIR synthase-related protein, partial [Pseudomonadota bacterium]